MHLGFNLLLWTTHVTEEHFPIIEKLKATGYDGVEIPVFEGDEKHFKKIGKVLRDNGLRATSVTVIPSAEKNPISPDKASRAAGLDHIKWAIDCSAACGSETLLGPFHSPLGVFSGQGATEDERKWGADVHRKAADHAAKKKVVLALEYLNRFECYFLNTLADAASYVRLVGHPNFGTMYDTFHANIEEKDPIGAIRQNIEVIRHVHISENDRGTPGKGHTPLHETIWTLQSCGYEGWMVIEAFGRALPALAAATRVWRDFFATREEVYEQGYRYLKTAVDSSGNCG